MAIIDKPGHIRAVEPNIESVDSDKIDATFAKGVLTVKLPKTAEAQKAGKKIAVKAA